jgi:hypothetical protein
MALHKDPTLADLEALLGKRVRIEYEDGSGGSGEVVRVDQDADGMFIILFDYGYAFDILPGTLITPEEEGEKS